MKATSFSKSPAGKQPIRIACYMSLDSESQFSNSFILADIGKMIASAKKAAVSRCKDFLCADAALSSASSIAWISAIAYEMSGSSVALISMCTTSIISMAALFSIYFKKGGQL